MFDPSALAVSQIPWTHRRRIGRIRAYCRTAWLASADPARLGGEAARPVDYREAQHFRLVTAALCALPSAIFATILTLAILAGMNPPPGLSMNIGMNNGPWIAGTGGTRNPPWDLLLPLGQGAMLWPCVPVAVALYALLLTGVSSYWFHPRSLPIVQQNRAVALSYYLCAPLSLTVVPMIMLGAAIWLLVTERAQAKSWFQVFVIISIIGAVTSLVLPGLTWWNTLKLLRRAAHASTPRVVSAAIGMPLAWLVGAVLCLLGLPWVVGYVALFVDSLRG
jgi:hypothetical protein